MTEQEFDKLVDEAFHRNGASYYHDHEFFGPSVFADPGYVSCLADVRDEDKAAYTNFWLLVAAAKDLL